MTYERIPVLKCSHCQNELEANTSPNGQFIEVKFCELCIGELQAENALLKDLLRWRNVSEEKPPLSEILLRGSFKGTRVIDLNEDGLKRLWYWWDDVKTYVLYGYDEWREI